MFETLSYENLQIYWWVIISLLGGLLVFLLFVQGGQTLFNKLTDTEDEKTLLVNVMGHKWEFTFTTLVLFGGAAFASFPLFYATSFGGAYWVWYIILFAFIIQAVSYEYRKKKGNLYGSKTWEAFLYINGVLAPILLGIAVSTFFTGSPFSVDKDRIIDLTVSNYDAIISQWATPWYGLDALWDGNNLAFLQNIALGLALFFLARLNALLYFRKMINNQNILKKIKVSLKENTILFLIFFLFWTIRLLFISGYAINPDTLEIVLEPYKYLHNLLANPASLILLLAGVVSVLWGIYLGIFKEENKAFWFSGIGTVLTVMAVFFLTAFNNTAFYPSNFDIQSSLTIANSSSSEYTLITMAYVTLMIPFVLAYIIWAWRVMDKKQMTIKELENEHKY